MFTFVPFAVVLCHCAVFVTVYSYVSQFYISTSANIFGCTEDELSERTRLLDRWMREICCCYKMMGDRNRFD